jgi:glycosyltransferase involved in cell wall biosynthesis
MGPSFGIRIWGPATWATLAAANYVRRLPEFGGIGGSREHFANYWRQYHYRLPIEAYTHERSRGDYIFFLSPVWKQEPRCNEYRASFIKACRSLRGVAFEGGFAPRRKGDVRGFEDFAVERRYPLPDYIAKLKRSLVAFNTPAVYGCLGWKLAEYLALGKAIISTPLGRALPAPLEHGRHIHFVDGSFDEIARAIELISSDGAYRRELENNAREYFLRHLAPAKCIERIVARAAGG